MSLKDIKMNFSVAISLARMTKELKKSNEILDRIAMALERISPPIPVEVDEIEVFIDEAIENPQEKDESEGLNDVI